MWRPGSCTILQGDALRRGGLGGGLFSLPSCAGAGGAWQDPLAVFANEGTRYPIPCLPLARGDGLAWASTRDALQDSGGQAGLYLLRYF